MNYIKTQSGELLNQRYITKIYAEKEKIMALMTNGECCLVGVYEDAERVLAQIAVQISCTGDVDCSEFK